jgi:3-mercaptopyruvate sulfurtransferase SseA
MNPRGTSSRHDYETGPRIAGARFLDIDDIADTTTKPSLPHLMPPAKLMAAAMDAMHIASSDHVIVYVQ